MRSLIFRASVLLLAALSITGSLFGQAATGTITGTITDPAGAVVAAAAIEVKNTETGTVYPTVSTATGAYTVPSLPVGAYQVSVTVQGFKKYNRTGLTLSAAQTLGIDVTLEVGSATESVSVNAEASLLKTETGDIAHNITLQQLDNLPILGIGGANAGSSGVRNPFNSTTLIPGVSYTSNSVMIVNGAPNNTASYRLEGLDNTNHTVNFALQQNQPSADAVQEIAVQTSNYAAEFGTAGGGLFNLTMKSGTNRYSGSVYDYFVNEALNAAVPFSNDGKGNKITPRNRRNNYGGTIGGPISIPHLYDGKNKSFFFFSYEAFKESSIINFPVTLPTDAYRAGDFSAISPNGGSKFNTGLGVPAAATGVDALGRNVFSNTIFDPSTRRTAPNGTLVADPFPGNVIPANRFDPVAVAFLKLVPNATSSGLTSNYAGSNLSQRDTKIPSIKLDHTVNAKLKLSGYWSTTGTDSPFSTPNGNADGLPANISVARGTFIHTLTERVNVDYNAAPTLLLHFGGGYSRNSFVDDSPFTHDGNTFDCKSVGLQGCQGNVNLPTLISTVSGTLGGMQQLGNAVAHTHTLTLRPGFNATATYIRGNHTYKAGAETGKWSASKQ